METSWCQYATDWAEIKQRWQLTMTKPESEAVVEMLQRCENPPVVEVWEALESATGEHKPEPAEELQNPVYGSCEEAEFAGSPGSKRARAEAWVIRRRWSRPHGMGTGMKWCVKSKCTTIGPTSQVESKNPVDLESPT